MQGENPEPEDSDPRVEELLGWVASEPFPEPEPDLVRRILQQVRGTLLFRDLAAFATLESVWEGLKRRRRTRAGSSEEPDA